VSLNGAPQLHNDTSPITNPGECVSFFATNRNYALLPAGVSPSPAPTSVTISKNYHGKLMSGINAWCKTQIAPKTGSTGSGASNGHGHGKHAQ